MFSFLTRIQISAYFQALCTRRKKSGTIFEVSLCKFPGEAFGKCFHCLLEYKFSLIFKHSVLEGRKVEQFFRFLYLNSQMKILENIFIDFKVQISNYF